MTKSASLPRWYYLRDGRRFGPVSAAELRRLAAAGRLLRTDRVSRDDRPDRWKEAGDVAGLFPPDGPTPAALAAPAAGTPKAGPRPDTGSARSETAAALPMAVPALSPAEPLWRRAVAEVRATVLTMAGHLAWVWIAARHQWQARGLRQRAEAARLQLGRRLYELGHGDPALRNQIAVFAERLRDAPAGKGSHQALEDECNELYATLAGPFLETPGAPADTESEFQEAAAARADLAAHARRGAEAKAVRCPSGPGTSVRLGAGYAVVAGSLLLAALGWNKSRRVITDLESEQRLAGAVGMVVCGLQIVNPDGTQTELADSTGTCFAVSANGHLLTNKHVVERIWNFSRAKHQLERLRRDGYDVQPTVWVFFGREKLVAEVLHVSDDYDLSILRVPRRHVPFFRLSNNHGLPRGKKVVACGFPGAAMTPLSPEEAAIQHRRGQTRPKRVEEQFKPRDFDFTLTDGSISRVTEENADGVSRWWIQHTAAINPGNSGGPLLLEDGTAVGINTLFARGAAANVPYSLALPQLRAEIEKHVQHPVWR